MPVIETVNQGVAKINLFHWLKKSPSKPGYKPKKIKPEVVVIAPKIEIKDTKDNKNAEKGGKGGKGAKE